VSTPNDESTAPQHPIDTPVPTPASPTPTYVISVVFLLVAVLFVMASPLDWYGAFKTIHVVFAVVWIGGGFLLSVLAFIAELEKDPQGKAIVANQASKVAMRVFTPSSLIVLLAGIAMMLNDFGKLQWDWGDFWVTFGLLGFVATFAIGIGVLTPTAKKIEALVQTVGPNSPEVHEAMNRIFLVARVDAAVLMLVVVDMTAKPFL
jgi:uncharacterized membrane protein